MSMPMLNRCLHVQVKIANKYIDAYEKFINACKNKATKKIHKTWTEVEDIRYDAGAVDDIVGAVVGGFAERRDEKRLARLERKYECKI